MARTTAMNDEAFQLTPSAVYLDANNLTASDLDAITRNTTQIATDRAANWSYEQRRYAQPILDFLYLGPTSAVRDHHFLRREGITMVVVVRDARIATPLMSVTRAVEEVGLQVSYVNIGGLHQLIHDLPAIIRDLNRHLLRIFQLHGSDGDGDEARRGKILVTCDSGNDRSAAVVCAYIMTMFGKDMLTTLQFVSIQRFCCTFDEDIKRMLQTYEDILRAKAAVAVDKRANAQHAIQDSKRSVKRGFDSTMDTDMGSPDGEDLNPDILRFTGRGAFAPFADVE